MTWNQIRLVAEKYGLSCKQVYDLVVAQKTPTNTDSLQCTVCGSTMINVIHECENCNAEIDISNWRYRAQQGVPETKDTKD